MEEHGEPTGQQSSQQPDRSSRFDLRTILDTSQLLARSHDIDFILNNLLLITMGKLLVTQGAILIYKQKKDRYRVAQSKGNDTPPKDKIIQAEHFEHIQQQTVTKCDDKTPLPPAFMGGKEGITLFNLQTKEGHLGFLCLGMKANGVEFSKQETDFVEGLVAISSVAVANGRVVQELKQTNRQLDRRNYELNTLLNLSKEFNTLVEREEIARTFKFAMLGQMLIRKFFFLLDQDGHRTVAAENNINGSLSENEIDQLFTAVSDRHIVDQTLAREIPFLERNNIHALFALEFQDEKLAIVGIGPRANGESYSEADYRFLQSLGNLALLSIQKTLLLEERIEKERLEEELNIAESIQQGLLPDPLPSHPKLDAAACNVPSRQMGGDYYDAIDMNGERILFAIGDVTGKSTPAALLMANLQAIIHVILPIDISLEKATARMNDMIYQNTPDDKFVTFFWGVFDGETATFSYVNAGHNPVLVFKDGDEQPQKLQQGGLLLGAMPTTTPYEAGEMELATGDLLVFYTDGVTEAQNPNGREEYQEERLVKCIQAHRDQPAEEIVDAIVRDVNRWSANTQYDDITLMVLKVQ